MRFPSVELLESPTVAVQLSFLQHSDLMVQLSPILPFQDEKDERPTNRLPAYYLVETIRGARGVLCRIDPRQLRRVQLPSPRATARPSGIFHAVYWHEESLPNLLQEEPARPTVIEIPESGQKVLQDYLADAIATVIGDEQRLNAEIAGGASSVPVVLWDGSNRTLPWLPCHRAVRDVEWFQTGWMVCLAREHLFFRDVSAEMLNSSVSGLPFDPATAQRMLVTAENEGVVMLAITRDGSWRIHSEPGWANGILEDHHPLLREIPVVQLEHIVLPKGLSLSALDGSRSKHVSVFHSSEEAEDALRDGAQVAYLLNPIHTAQLQELVKQGQMLPADSVALDLATLEVWNHAR